MFRVSGLGCLGFRAEGLRIVVMDTGSFEERCW